MLIMAGAIRNNHLEMETEVVASVAVIVVVVVVVLLPVAARPFPCEEIGQWRTGEGVYQVGTCKSVAFVASGDESLGQIGPISAIHE